MSDKCLKSILVVIITALYGAYFYFNCIIIPYTAVYDKYIVSNEQKNIFGQEKHRGNSILCPDTGAQGEQHALDSESETVLYLPVSPGQEARPSRDNTGRQPGDGSVVAPDNPKQGAQEMPVSPVQLMQSPSETTGQHAKAPTGETGQRVQAPSDTSGYNEQSAPDGARQSGSRVLLSGSRTAKALSSLSLRDKLWLITLLSRCSMEELLGITALLEDGVTYQENLEMYMMLRQRVTDDEQKRLDTLIEAYIK